MFFEEGILVYKTEIGYVRFHVHHIFLDHIQEESFAKNYFYPNWKFATTVRTGKRLMAEKGHKKFIMWAE